MRNVHMRVAHDFKLLVYKIKIMALKKGKEISCEEVTQIFTKYIDIDKVYANEFIQK